MEISFKTKSGILSAKRTADLIELDFPVWVGTVIKLPIGFEAAHGCFPDEYLCSSRNIAVSNLKKMSNSSPPDLAYINGLDGGGLIITASGDTCDFV